MTRSALNYHGHFNQYSTMTTRNRFRWLSLAGFLACTTGLGFAYYLQHLGYDPCPLCIFQRVAMAAVALIFIAAAVHAPKAAGRWVYAAAAAAASLSGAALGCGDRGKTCLAAEPSARARSRLRRLARSSDEHHAVPRSGRHGAEGRQQLRSDRRALAWTLIAGLDDDLLHRARPLCFSLIRACIPERTADRS
jgi:hypothetical protein